LAEIEGLNADYEVARWAPGFLAFATSGGGEMYAFAPRVGAAGRSTRALDPGRENVVSARYVVLLSSLVGAISLAAEPVRSISIYVIPYYRSAEKDGDRPQVHTAREYDALLSSARREDIVAARDMIQADNALITPMTLMVLAIRLYDVGLRDDSVFWFYVAKYRWSTLAAVADENSEALAGALDATRNFAILAGPFINGYAFCDLKNQHRLMAASIEWVEHNEYQAIRIPQLPKLPGNPDDNLRAGLAKNKQDAKKEIEYLADPNNLQNMQDARKKSGAEEMFCWKQ